MRRINVLVVLPMLFSGALWSLQDAAADGPVVLPLQGMIASQPSISTGPAVSAATMTGRDVSNATTVRQISRQMYGVRTLAERQSEVIDVQDFAPVGQPIGQAMLTTITVNQTVAGKTINVIGIPTIAVGAYVTELGIQQGTKIVSVAAADGNHVSLTLSLRTTQAMVAGQLLMIGPSDDTSAFTAAANAANSLPTSNVLFVPRGNYMLDYGQVPVTYGKTTWKIDPGAVIYGADIPGFWGNLNFAGGAQGLSLGRNDVSPGNSNMLFLSQNIGITSTATGSEKNVINIACSDGDSIGPVSLTNPALGNNANLNTACIGLHGTVRLANALHGGTVWGSQFNIQIPFGTDGYAVAMEYGLENAGIYSPEIGQGSPKVGLKEICSGPQDCTVAHEFETAGGQFHMFDRYYQPALRKDGWAWIYEAIGYVPLADVDYAGNLYAQTLRGADLVVAALPTNCKPGQIVHTTDGRKPGEAAGEGSGTNAECELTIRGGTTTGWYSMIGGSMVTD